MRRLFALGIVILLAMSVIPSAYALSTHSDITISGNTLTFRIVSDNPVTISDETPGYEPVNGTVTVDGVGEFETISIVNSENGKGGIADDTGHVNVTFTLNDDRPFCIAITKDNGLISSMTVTVTINGVTKQYSSNLAIISITQYIGNNGRYFDFSSLSDNNDWISSDSEITIRITDNFGYVPENVTASVLFA